MKHQQTFTKVVTCASKQNSKAIKIDDPSCFYRENHTVDTVDLHKGRMCFVGAFIPDTL